MNIAVLMTCHNRKKETTQCLSAILKASQRTASHYKIYLVDDGSSDNTTEAVRKCFPDVSLLSGNGTLFWCGGMRKAWDAAVCNGPYDAYLWLNDDTVLFNDAFLQLEEMHRQHPRAVLTGACRDEIPGRVTYGFLGRKGLISPITPPLRLSMEYAMNGNCVWVPCCVFDQIGNLSSVYQHSRGDSDYGWRAVKAGFDVLLTPFFVGTCSRHDHIQPRWQKLGLTLGERWRCFNSPKGVPFKEYVALNLLRYPMIGWLSIFKWFWIFARTCLGR